MCACASTRRRINVFTAEQHDDDVTRRFGKAETSSSSESGPPATTTSSPTRRRMILLASTTAAERMTFANGSSFGASSEWATLNDGSAPGLASPPPSKGADPIVRKTERLGLKYEVLASGSGNDCVEMHDVVDVDYVMRRANGYFIYSNADCGIGCGDGDPERWAIADGFIETIPEMLVGAKKGEVRKFLVKPEFGYTTKNLKPQPPEFGQRRQIEAHCTEPLLFEVRVVKIRKQRKGDN